jgi:hypothetical protein
MTLFQVVVILFVVRREEREAVITSRESGLREAEDRRYAQFIGAVAQCIPQLIDRLDK